MYDRYQQYVNKLNEEILNQDVKGEFAESLRPPLSEIDFERVWLGNLRAHAIQRFDEVKINTASADSSPMQKAA